jgi:hypothetical protein
MDDCLPSGRWLASCPMIYCVVPEPLADELYDRLAKYYEDDPNVTVIIDRRKSERRDTATPAASEQKRELRDRRRRRPGELPPLVTGEA